MLNRDQMAKTAQLSQFDEELYRVSEGPTPSESDRYLIATSEQPLSALHAEEWIQPAELPIKYCGYSTCFRKEAGSHGRDAWGVFRVHQFEKVEQFVLCGPDDSWDQFDQMMANSEEFYKSLGLPYQVVGIVTGALNNAAAKKYDLEAWFPFQKEYKELVSCSNCTDYQTRELEIRHGAKKGKQIVGGGKKEYVHALNAVSSLSTYLYTLIDMLIGVPRHSVLQSEHCAVFSRTTRPRRVWLCPRCCESTSPESLSSFLSSRRLPRRPRRPIRRRLVRRRRHSLCARTRHERDHLVNDMGRYRGRKSRHSC
jgi:hypothetical protein